MVGAVSGALTGSNRCGCDFKKKKTSFWSCFFLAGHFQSQITFALCDRGSRTVTLLHTKFCDCEFSLADAAFSKPVAERTLSSRRCFPANSLHHSRSKYIGKTIELRKLGPELPRFSSKCNLAWGASVSQIFIHPSTHRARI